MFKGTVVFLSVVTAATAAFAQPSQAATVQCGAAVAGDVVLTQDLHCAGTALYVSLTKSGPVHIDLQGHQLLGDDTGSGILVTRDSAAVRSLLVTGGSIAHFDNALATDRWAGRSDLVVDNVNLTSNHSWLSHFSAFRNMTVLHSAISYSLAGGSPPDGVLTVIDSHFVNAGVTGGEETYNYLYGNTFTNGGFSQHMLSNVTAVGNHFNGCNIGISIPDVFAGPATQVSDNVFTGCKVGLSLSTRQGYAIVRGNTFTRNGTGFTFATGSFTTMQVTANQFLQNRGNGLVGTGTAKTVVLGNRAVDNSGHGITVTGVTDGGTNTALGNHVAPDCVGVVCTSS